MLTNKGAGGQDGHTITVTTISGKSITIVAPGTIAQAKERIQTQLRIPPKFQQLLRNGEILTDTMTVLPTWKEFSLVIQAGREFEVH